jgi:hypothetical protein
MLKRYAIKRKADMVAGETYLMFSSKETLIRRYRHDEDVQGMLRRSPGILTFGKESHFWAPDDPAAVIDTQDEWHRLHERATDEEIVAAFEQTQREGVARVDVNGLPCVAAMHNGYVVLVGMPEVRAAWSRVLKQKIGNKKLTLLVQIDHEDFV